jgi:hypothetical protein
MIVNVRDTTQFNFSYKLYKSKRTATIIFIQEMIHVSEKPWTSIQVGSAVSIIEAKYVTFNAATFKEEVRDNDAKYFLKGILLSKEAISALVIFYCVKLDDSHDIISFQESPRKYYFKKEE